jgi:hypothetical protein
MRAAVAMTCSWALVLSAATLAADEAPRLSLGQSFDAELLRDLPVHRLWSLLEVADATAIVDRIENGGLYTGEAQRFSVHGASWTQATFRLEGLDLTDPWGGAPLHLPDLRALAVADLVTGAAPARLGGAGPVVDLALRRPGASWSGELAVQALPGGRQAQGEGTAPAIARFESLRRATFQLQGPLIAERVSLLVAGAVRSVERLEREETSPLEGRERSLVTQLVWTPSEGEERRLLAALQAARHPYSGRARLAGAAPAGQDDRFLNLQASWSRRGGSPWAVRAGYARGSFSPETEEEGAAVVERLRDGPVPLLFEGNGTRDRWALAASLQPFAERPARALQGLELGVEASRARSATRSAETRRLTPERVDGVAARVWDYGWAAGGSDISTFDGAAFASDRVQYRALGLEAGLRLELTRGSAAGGDRVRWTRLMPRLSSRLRLLGADRLALRAGYAEYRHRLPHFLLAHGDPGARQGLVYRWQDTNANGLFEAGEQGPLIARAGPGGERSTIDDGLRPPSTREMTVGFEATLAAGWTASLIGVSRREDDLVGARNVGAPESAYDLILLPDPNKDLLGPQDDHLLPIYDRRPETFGEDRYVLTNVPGNMLHEGVEILVRGRVGERLRVLFAGTASRSEGPAGNPGFRTGENDHGVVGEQLSPNATTSERGRLFFDRAYTLNLLGTWRTQRDTRLGFAARYQDGQPFSRLVIPTGLRQGPEPVSAQPERSRFTFTFTLDARLEQGIRVGRTRLGVGAEVLNVLGTSNEVEEDVVTGARYRTVTAVQPPRAVLLELRAEF